MGNWVVYLATKLMLELDLRVQVSKVSLCVVSVVTLTLLISS